MRENSDLALETDPRRIVEKLRLPGTDIERIVSSQRENVEALTHANQIATDTFQAIARRQAEIMQELFESARQSMRSLSETNAPGDRAIKQTELANAAFEAALLNMRQLAEMVAKANSDAFDVINRRVAASLDELKNMVSQSSAPTNVGRESLVDFLSRLPFGEIEIERSESFGRDIEL